MMDKLSGNYIPSDSNDERLDNGDGETENDELYQLSKISCAFPLVHGVHNSAHIFLP